VDLYVLDDLFRRVEIFDVYESLIWTDRWIGMGDFELVIDDTWTNRNILKRDARLAINDSDHIMVIQTTVRNQTADGKKMLTVSGKSLEQILEDRVAKPNFTSLATSPRWVLEGTPGTIIRSMVDAICVDGILSPNDVIEYLIVPFVQGDSIWPPDTLPEPGGFLHMELEPKSLYDAVKELCVEYNLGFGILRNPDKAELYFEVWSGSDRSGGNATGLAPVIFSPELDNLTDTTELRSKETYKNVAYVLSDKGCTIVYANDDGSDRTGFRRRVLTVVVENVRENTNESYMTNEQILQRRGLEALTEHRMIHALDGEISKDSSYRYGIDYRLGDIVELRSSDDINKAMRVTEQIFVSDGEGDRAYPTLASNDL
jgi:hypothetical protein